MSPDAEFDLFHILACEHFRLSLHWIVFGVEDLTI